MTRLAILLLLLPAPCLALVLDLPNRPEYVDFAGYAAPAATRILDYYGLVSDPLATIQRIDTAMCAPGFCVSDGIGPEMVAIANELGFSASYSFVFSTQISPAVFSAEVNAGRPSLVFMDFEPGPKADWYAGVLAGVTDSLFGVDWGFGSLNWYSWSMSDTSADGMGFHDLLTFTAVPLATPVPEPSTLLLMAAGICIVLLRSGKSAFYR